MKEFFDGTFKGRTVLITGHTGFKGAWLSIWLDLLGARVVGYALDPPTEPSLFKAAALEGNLEHITGDVRDAEQLVAALDQYRPEFVFHLAAQPLVRLSYNDPRTTYETNIMGTFNLLEAVRNCNSVRVCQIITSDKCYENQEWVYSYRENDPLGGHDPYSSSKACAELITSSYRRSFLQEDDTTASTIALSSTRAGNVIGGGDWAPERLIPDCVRTLNRKEQIRLRNPDAIRPWQYVLEPLSGYLWLAKLMLQDGFTYSGAWNFGPAPTDNLTVKDLVNRFLVSWGPAGLNTSPLESAKDPNRHEAGRLMLDCTKSQTLLGWKPVYDVDTAIKKTAEWYRNFYTRPNMDSHQLSVDQIGEFCEAALKARLPWTGNGISV